MCLDLILSLEKLSFYFASDVLYFYKSSICLVVQWFFSFFFFFQEVQTYGPSPLKSGPSMTSSLIALNPQEASLRVGLKFCITH